MKRLLITSFCVFVFSATLYVPSLCNADEIESLVDTAKSLILKKDFEDLATLYLYPLSYSDEERQEERKNISEGLRFLSREFGEIYELELSQENAQRFEFFLTGGDVDFVKSHPDFQTFVYKTIFSNVGSGYVFVQVYENSGQPKLRGSGYGLPVSQENFPMAKSIADKLMETMKARTKETK